jgi:hypothetical protein
MLLADAITAVSAQFDTSTSATSDTVIRSWIHRCVREAVAQAKWRKVRRELGTTTAALAQDAAESPADGDTSLVRLWPAPEESGLTITALCAVQALAITAATTAATFEIGVPDDLAAPIAIDGPIAMGLREALGRHDDAAQYQARYELGKNELARRANSRASGGAIFVRPGRR